MSGDHQAELHARVVGRVQGVGYRAFVARTANALGVRGHVLNQADGTVEVRALGDRAAIEALHAALERGPRLARVTGVHALPTITMADCAAFEVLSAGAPATVAASHERALRDRVLDALVDVPDFPRPGILFKDVTALLADGSLFGEVVHRLTETVGGLAATRVAAIESRGFLFGAAVAATARIGLVPVRKAGKLPREVHEERYALEYGANTLTLHTDACAGERVVIVDDVLATGGTAAAAARLVRRAGGQVTGYLFVLEIAAAGGRAALDDAAVHVIATA